ncbi:hypothetical protein FRC16_005433 [Serendipita sp. 398]|nr:hypothetical protein FRC16_005433 [Serendipita sp. 398]
MFIDRTPAASEHYLIIPRNHIGKWGIARLLHEAEKPVCRKCPKPEQDPNTSCESFMVSGRKIFGFKFHSKGEAQVWISHSSVYISGPSASALFRATLQRPH